MGHKVNPIVFRLGQVKNWESRWFDFKKYKNNLKEDLFIRDYVLKKFGRQAAIDRIGIERSPNLINVIVYTARPGIIIGRGGIGAQELKEDLERQVFKPPKKKKDLRIEIQEIREPQSYARLVAIGIAEQIERRLPFRRVLKQAISKVMSSKDVKGVKIAVSGRLGGHEMARTEWLGEGEMPLQNLRANIDYAHENAHTTYGVVGIKVWIYKGEVFEENKNKITK